MRLPESGYQSIFLVLGLCILSASPAVADGIITVQGNATYTHIFKNGTTPFTATVGNDSTAGESLDWSISNNPTTGLTLSGSGTGLAPSQTIGVSGSYTGSDYGIFDIQAEATAIVSGGGTAANSPLLSSAVSITVGYVLAGNAYTSGSWTPEQLEAFGTPVSTVVAAGGSYAGLAVKVIGLEGGGSNYVGTEMIFRAGKNTAATSTVLTMSFRNRTDIETNAVPYVSSLSNPPVAYDSYGQVSDVANVTGMTGVFVLQSDYDENAIIYTNPNYSEELLATDDWLYLGWFEPGAGGKDPQAAEWVHATEGNSTVGSSAVFNFQGSWDDFIAIYTDYDTNLAAYLGSYGVDIDDNTVWAVLDHNSAFSVVPEPVTMSFLLCGALALLIHRRRSSAN